LCPPMRNSFLFRGLGFLTGAWRHWLSECSRFSRRAFLHLSLLSLFISLCRKVLSVTPIPPTFLCGIVLNRMGPVMSGHILFHSLLQAGPFLLLHVYADCSPKGSRPGEVGCPFPPGTGLSSSPVVPCDVSSWS